MQLKGLNRKNRIKLELEESFGNPSDKNVDIDLVKVYFNLNDENKSCIDERTWNQFQSVLSNGAITSENQQTTISRIKDADIAKETADMAKNSILTQSTISVLGQANSSNQAVLKLFN